MSTDADRTYVVAVVATEWEATLVVDALKARGIEVEASGMLTSAFRAEAPGGVKIICRQADAERALAAMKEYQAESSEIDWSKVDLGGES
jgi:hypothetical protein